MALNTLQHERLSRFSKDQLLEFIDTLQKNWWNLQNNYILHINTEYGEAAAVKADGICFPANARVQVFRLKKMLGLKDDVASLKEAMILSTIWTNCDYEMWDVDERTFRIQVTNCYQQVRRVEDGLGEIGCKPAGIAICEAAVKAIHPGATVKCLVCPPDKHPAEVWCDWEFHVPERG
jgi:hypothetical protein